MKRTNWQTADFPGMVEEIDASRLSWLCGCGRSVKFTESKAYPICPECGQRMRILDEPHLGYVRTGAAATAHVGRLRR